MVSSQYFKKTVCKQSDEISYNIWVITLWCNLCDLFDIFYQVMFRILGKEKVPRYKSRIE